MTKEDFFLFFDLIFALIYFLYSCFVDVCMVLFGFVYPRRRNLKKKKKKKKKNAKKHLHTYNVYSYINSVCNYCMSIQLNDIWYVHWKTKTVKSGKKILKKSKHY